MGYDVTGAGFGHVAPAEYAPRRRSHVGAILLTVLLSLAVLAVVADRLAVSAVERSVVESVVEGAEPGSITGPELQIHGFPFFTQVLSGRLNELSGSMESGNFGGLTVEDLHFDATGVTPQEPFHAEFARADALAPYATMEQLITAQLPGFVSDARVAVDSSNPDALFLTGNAVGIAIGISATPTPLPPHGVRIDIDEVTLGGVAVPFDSLPFGIGDQLHNITFELPLPAEVELTGLSVEPGGLRVQVDATNVDLETVFEQSGGI